MRTMYEVGDVMLSTTTIGESKASELCEPHMSCISASGNYEEVVFSPQWTMRNGLKAKPSSHTQQSVFLRAFLVFPR
jgi:hypothetical protein